MEDIVANIAMIDTMIIKFNIENIEKASNNKELKINCQLSAGLPIDIKLERSRYEIGLRVKVSLQDDEKYISKIDSEIKGIFEINSNNKEEVIELLKYNGIPLLYQEMRAYITNITAVSHNRTVILPMVNFKKYFKNVENKM